MDETFLYNALQKTLGQTHFSDLGERYQGKVRDNYTLKDGRRVMVVTDRVSAFDHVLGTLPFKGQILNQLSTWWFEQTRELVPNHLLEVIDPQVIVCTECKPLSLEFVVRGYLTGVTSTSIWTHYQEGQRKFGDIQLKDGMRKHEALPKPVLTPSTKAAHGAHDETLSKDEVLKRGLLSAQEFEEASAMAFRLFEFGQKVCRERGLFLVDTKYEFGKTPKGELVVIDEIHTPDSSRFWTGSTYEEQMRKGEDPLALDKEYLRRWLVTQGYRGEGTPPAMTDAVRVEASKRYIEAYEAIAGQAFAANFEEPLLRIQRHLDERRLLP